MKKSRNSIPLLTTVKSRKMSEEGEKRTIERDCTVCGTTIQISVDEDGRYDGGHYFGEWSVPDDDSDGEFKKTGEYKGHDVVEWTGERLKFEYWECDDCFFSEPSNCRR
jgi:hypothetical protein